MKALMAWALATKHAQTNKCRNSTIIAAQHMHILEFYWIWNHGLVAILGGKTNQWNKKFCNALSYFWRLNHYLIKAFIREMIFIVVGQSYQWEFPTNFQLGIKLGTWPSNAFSKQVKPNNWSLLRKQAQWIPLIFTKSL